MVDRVPSFLRGVLRGWDGVDFLRGLHRMLIISDRVEMNFDDDVEGSDQERSESGG